MLNLFSLHGRYFRDDENRFTAQILFLLSEFRSDLLPGFLDLAGVRVRSLDLSRLLIAFQSRFATYEDIDIPDADLRLDDELHVLVEAKIGSNGLGLEQLRSYARHLRDSRARVRRLVCVTQVDDRRQFTEIARALEPSHLPRGTMVYLRWFQVLDLIKSALGVDDSGNTGTDRRVRRGRPVDYGQRLATLFLREVQQTMYDRKVIDLLPAGDLDDVLLTTQNRWFMDVAKRHRVWFPSGKHVHGFRPARYVAYYETGDGENAHPKQIAYLARNKIVWSRIALGDAKRLVELRHLFADAAVRKEISGWYGDDETFHVGLTEPPIKLRRPIPLGSRNVARVLVGRRYSLVDLMNARSIDDLV